MAIQASLSDQEGSSLRRNVLIVGGGPAGLAVALMLAKRGWTDITVLEKRSAANYYEPDKSFNYLIDGRGQKFTDLLGLTEQLSTIGVSSTEFLITRIKTDGSQRTVKLPLIDSTHQPAYWVPRRALLQLLHEEIQQNWSNSITVLFNTRCTAIAQRIKNTFEGLEVTIQDESSNLKQCLEPNFLIGCDGLRSIVRSTLNHWDSSGRFEMQQFPSPSSGLRYKVLILPPNFSLDAAGNQRAVSTMSYAIRGAFRERRRSLSLGLLPIKDPQAPRTANLITQPDHQLWQFKTAEAVLDFLVQVFPQLPLKQIISTQEVERFANSPGGTFPTPQFCSGLQYILPQSSNAETHETTGTGILLLGDAVHCFPPDIGQGVNSALEDVFVLNQVLAENEDDLLRSLPDYQTVRSPDVNALVRLAQIAAPWQYNQNRFRARLWTIAFLVRLGLSQVLPFVSPPAFMLIQNPQLSYHDIWLKHQRTSQALTALTLISLAAVSTIAVLLVKYQWL